MFDKANNIIKFEKDPDLLPCPFCGNKEIDYCEYEIERVGIRWGVFCTNCLAEIDPGWAQDKYIVKEMWNRRIQKGEK